MDKLTSDRCIFWVTGILVFTLISCGGYSDDPGLGQVLARSGKNRAELVKVLKHFSKKKEDSLQLRAAYFLIGNMDGMQTLDTGSVNNDRYFNYLHSLKVPDYQLFSVASKGIDSINRALKITPSAGEGSYVDELSIVSAEFLIRNIDSAFHVWRNMPWDKSVSFDDFCEYILPYRCTGTYSANIRDFFLDKYRTLPDSIRSLTGMQAVGQYIVRDVNSWFVENVELLPKYPFLKPMKFSDLLKGRVGECSEANSVRVAALRAMGVAAAFDQIPNWGNDHLPHFWYKIVDPKNDTVKLKITNANTARYTQHIISASSFDEPLVGGTPSNVQVNFNRTIPKVYRSCFSKQTMSLAWISGSAEIPPFFQNVRLKDVTNEYLETSAVNLGLSSGGGKRKFAYLCVFDNEKWLPVAWAEVKNGKVEFKDMGKNIVYLPAYYENDKIVPAGDPFLFDLNGNIEPIVADKRNEEVRLITKFPVRTYVISWESHMLGGRFQLANAPDLSDTVTVHTVGKLPFYETVIPVRNHRRYRYLIYQFSRSPAAWGDGWISELGFYGSDRNGKEVKLSGTPIGNPGEYPHLIEKLFDSIYFNVYKPDMSRKERFAGIDLGEGNEAAVTKIKFMPLTDDNAVNDRDKYELFYWGRNGWSSLGLSKAVGGVKYVTFENVPANALLLLKNTSGGKQQRIFVYKEGKQVFW
jgi:hypothetical protein